MIGTALNAALGLARARGDDLAVLPEPLPAAATGLTEALQAVERNN